MCEYRFVRYSLDPFVQHIMALPVDAGVRLQRYQEEFPPGLTNLRKLLETHSGVRPEEVEPYLRAVVHLL